MFSTQFHSKICKSWYYCCNCITTQTGTRHNRFASFILYDSSRTVFYEHLKNGQCFRHNFTQKYANRDIIAAIALRLNQELDITGLPPSFYMIPPELFTRNNKKWSMFSTQFHSKICKSWYYCCNCITTQSGTRHNRFASFILYDSSRTIY